jgi:hypothetical protein
VSEAKMLWDISKGLNISEKAASIHFDTLTSVVKDRLRSTTSALRTVHNMSKMSLSSNSSIVSSLNGGKRMVMKVDSGGDDQPHVHTMQDVIREVSKLMVESLECGLSGTVAFNILQMLHTICIENLISIIEMFTLDRQLEIQLKAATVAVDDITKRKRAKAEAAKSTTRGGSHQHYNEVNKVSASSTAEVIYDTDALDLMLDETVIICQLCERYARYIMQTYLDLGGEAGPGLGK